MDLNQNNPTNTTENFPNLENYKTLQDFCNLSVNIGGASKRFDANAVSFNDMLNMAADIQSGMILTLDQDTKQTTMHITKEYSLKSKKVKVDLACKLFGISVDDTSINLETWMFLMKVVEASGFISRLEELNKAQ